MARKPMVTRSFKTTTVTVLGMDLIHEEPCNQTFALTRASEDEKKLMKQVEALCDENFKPVKVVKTVEETHLYGMTEQQFLALATVIEKADEEPITTEEQ